MSVVPGHVVPQRSGSGGFTRVTGSGTIFNPSTGASTSLLAVEKLPSKEEEEEANQPPRGAEAAPAYRSANGSSQVSTSDAQNDAMFLLGLSCSREPSASSAPTASAPPPPPIVSRHSSCASVSSSAAAPVARADDPRLVILENIGKFAETNTWHQEVDGVKLLTTTVNTVRRVALVSDKMDAVAPSMMRVEQSLLLHSTGATITSGPPHLKSSRPLYKNLEDEATVHELRSDGTRGGATASANGVGCQQCFGETTFKFKFNITCARDIVGGDPHTLLRLRYSVVGHPEVFVDTIPFRLVAKEDPQRKRAEIGGPGRLVSNLPGLLKSLKEAQRLLERELGAVPASDPNETDGDVLSECQQVAETMYSDMSKLMSQRGPQLGVRQISAMPFGYGQPSPAGTTTAMPPVPTSAAPATANMAGRGGGVPAPQPAGNVAREPSVRSEPGVDDLSELLPMLLQEGPDSAEANFMIKADEVLKLLEITYDEVKPPEPKRQRVVGAADEEAKFRSCKAEDAADASPSVYRGLQGGDAHASPPVRPGSALAVASQQPPVLRLQELLRGAWRNVASRSLDARTRLAAVVRQVLALRRQRDGAAANTPRGPGGVGVVAHFSHDGSSSPNCVTNDLSDQLKELDALKASLEKQASVAQLVCDE